MLSFQLRYEVVTGTIDPYIDQTSPTRRPNTHSGLRQGDLEAGGRRGELHPFFSLTAGGGTFDTSVDPASHAPTSAAPNMNQACVDTIRRGPILVGPGGGIIYDLTESLSGVLQVNAVLAFPDFASTSTAIWASA